MFFSSAPNVARKSDYAAVLLLALGFCALARDERVFFAGTGAAPGMADARVAEAADIYAASPPGREWDDALHLPRGQAVVIGDFYFDPALLTERLRRAGAISRAVVVHVYDPAESALAPYAGRTIFSAQEASETVDDVDGSRAEYAALFSAHVDALRAAAARAGWGFVSAPATRDPADVLGDIAALLADVENAR